MFSGTDYVLRFAQTLVQILVLLALVMIIARYPQLVEDLTGIGVKVSIERDSRPANGDAIAHTGSLQPSGSPSACK